MGVDAQVANAAPPLPTASPRKASWPAEAKEATHDVAEPTGSCGREGASASLQRVQLHSVAPLRWACAETHRARRCNGRLQLASCTRRLVAREQSRRLRYRRGQRGRQHFRRLACAERLHSAVRRHAAGALGIPIVSSLAHRQPLRSNVAGVLEDIPLSHWEQLVGLFDVRAPGVAGLALRSLSSDSCSSPCRKARRRVMMRRARRPWSSCRWLTTTVHGRA